MSTVQRFIKRLPILTLCSGVGLAFGLLVPSIYDLGERSSSRRDPEMEFAALVVLLIALIAATVVWFWNKPADELEKDSNEAVRFQFGIRHILITTTVIALAVGVAPLFSPGNDFVNWLMLGLVIGAFVWTLFQQAEIRARCGAVMASLFLPFVWIIAYNKPFGHVSGMLPGTLFGPGLLPAMLLRRGNIDNSVWIAFLFVILELGIGFWLARRGRKLFVGYVTLCLLLSGFTSFVFHALYRM